MCAANPDFTPVLLNAFELRSSNQQRFIAMMEGVKESSLKEIPSDLNESWASTISSADDYNAIAAINALAGRHHSLIPQLKKLATNSDVSTSRRLVAIAALLPGSISSRETDVLITIVQTGTPQEAEQAITLLSRVQLSSSQFEAVMNLVTTAGPIGIQGLLKLFHHLQSDELHQKLAGGLSTARSRKTLSISQLNQLSKNWSPAAKQKLRPLIEELQGISVSQLEKLERLEPLIKHASSSRGETVFFSEKSKCAACHRIGDKGGMIGPDLSGIGLIRRERDLLEAILFPSNSFAREYEPYSILIDSGTVFSGLISHETEEALFVQQATGDPVELRRTEIESIVPAAVSVMPQGLETGLNDTQLADLVAFLRAQTNPPVKRETVEKDLRKVLRSLQVE